MRKGIIVTYKDVEDGVEIEGHARVFGFILHSYAGLLERLCSKKGDDFIVTSVKRI